MGYARNRLSPFRVSKNSHTHNLITFIQPLIRLPAALRPSHPPPTVTRWGAPRAARHARRIAEHNAKLRFARCVRAELSEPAAGQIWLLIFVSGLVRSGMSLRNRVQGKVNVLKALLSRVPVDGRLNPGRLRTPLNCPKRNERD